MSTIRFDKVKALFDKQYSAIVQQLTDDQSTIERQCAGLYDTAFANALRALQEATTYRAVEVALNQLGLLHLMSGQSIEAIKAINRAAFLQQANTDSSTLKSDNYQYLFEHLQANAFKNRLAFIKEKTDEMTRMLIDRFQLDRYDNYIFELEYQLRQFTNGLKLQIKQGTDNQGYKNMLQAAEDLLADNLFNEIKANIQQINEREKLLKRAYVTTPFTPDDVIAKSSEQKTIAEGWLQHYLTTGSMEGAGSAPTSGKIRMGSEVLETDDGKFTVVPVPLDSTTRAATLIERGEHHVSAMFAFQQDLSKLASLDQWLLLDWAKSSIESIYYQANRRDLPITFNLEMMPERLAKALVLYCEAKDISYHAHGIWRWKPSQQDIAFAKEEINKHSRTRSEESALQTDIPDLTSQKQRKIEKIDDDDNDTVTFNLPTSKP